MANEYGLLTNRRVNVFSDIIFRRVSSPQRGVNITQQEIKKNGKNVDSSIVTKRRGIRAVGLTRKNKDLL
jgi:hypothetical protein